MADPSASHRSYSSDDMSPGPSGRKRQRPSDEERPGKASGPAKRNRASLNCQECRRLKMRCDRNVPCGGCVKRGCAYLCPDGTMASLKARREEHEHLNQRIMQLESALNEKGKPVPQINGGQAESSRQASKSTHRESGSWQHALPGQFEDFGDRPFPSISPVTSADITSPATTTRTPSVREADRPMQFPPPLTSPVRPTVSARSSREDAQLAGPIMADPPYRPGENSSGTLVLNKSGRVRFIGPSAGSQWLREGDQEVEESRATSPFRDHSPYGPRSDLLQQHTEQHNSMFPFAESSKLATYASMRSELPTEEEARVLVDSYYRHVTWNATVILRANFIDIIKSIYREDNGGEELQENPKLQLHKLALVMIVLALGTLLNLEIPPHDPSADRFYILAKSCLAKGDFLHHNTLVSVQALYIMAEYLSYAEQGEGGDRAWPIWGIATRVMQAMGLHRDGEKWDLSPQELDDRRRIFWEVHTTDVFQSNCWGRPSAMSPDQFDTRFPIDLEAITDAQTGVVAPGFHTLKFSFAGLSKEVLNEALRIQPSPYERVLELWHKIGQFEQDIPYHLRCRAAMKAMASRYASPIAAEADSPPPSKKDLRLTFQQHALALCCCEGVLFLLRPFFSRALYESPIDPLQTRYGEAYLAIIERCSMIIALVRSLQSLFPSITARHWFFWSHCFSAAVCLTMVIIVSPGSPLAPLALSEVENVIDLFTKVTAIQTGRRNEMNLRWLQRLRNQAHHKMNTAAAAAPSKNGNDSDPSDDVAAHVGWRTRLVQQGERRARDMSFSLPKYTRPPPDASMPLTGNATMTREELEMFPAVDFDSADFLQQLLDVPVSHTFPLQAGDSFMGHASLLGTAGLPPGNGMYQFPSTGM